jgi:hypothetical protein
LNEIEFTHEFHLVADADVGDDRRCDDAGALTIPPEARVPELDVDLPASGDGRIGGDERPGTRVRATRCRRGWRR